jgi:hypothetical protein
VLPTQREIFGLVPREIWFHCETNPSGAPRAGTVPSIRHLSFGQTKAKMPVTLPVDGSRPRPETRRFARILAATFSGLFLIILALIAIADHASP